LVYLFINFLFLKTKSIDLSKDSQQIAKDRLQHNIKVLENFSKLREGDKTRGE